MDSLMMLWEAVLFLADRPVTAEELSLAMSVPVEELERAARELMASYGEDRGIVVREVAGGYQMVTSPAVSAQLGLYFKRVRRVKLSRAALETLALVAYRQPVTRAEVEQIRGVDSSGVIGTLLDVGLVAILGRREVPGKPLIYGTTPTFLERFGLKGLSDLPTMEELSQLLAETSDTLPEDAAPGETLGEVPLPEEERGERRGEERMEDQGVERGEGQGDEPDEPPAG